MSRYRKKGLYNKWWVRVIRSINLFCFRCWWLYWIILILLLLSAYLFCPSCNMYFGRNCDCPPCANQEFLNDSISDQESQILDTIPKPPSENCRVHFSGVFMGGWQEGEVSLIYQEDQFSEFVGSGSYPSNEAAFPKSVAHTFDGIAIDKGTRLIIYRKKNFQGEILIDVIGPAIICNKKFRDHAPVNHVMTDVFPGNLQSTYPPSVRRYSSTDMHNWSFGSCRITCGQ